MKRLKTGLIVALGAIFMIFAVLFVAACDETVTYHSVRAEYDETQGVVTLSEPASEQGYAAGEKVSVTVTANEGYEILKVTVNGAVASSSGSFTFTVTEDTIVKATFREKETVPDGYTVSVTVNDETLGSAELSAPANGEKYAAGEEVTLTVTPADGYTVRDVVVNGRPVSLTEGKYSFAVNQNTAVSVNFIFDDSFLPETNVTFAVGWWGEWSTVDGSHTMHFSENRMSLDGVGISQLTASENTQGEGYEFTSDSSYLVTWADGYYSVNAMLELVNESNGTHMFFIKDSYLETPVSILEDHWGDWYLGDDVALTITENSIIYHGVKADVIVDIGYLEESLDGWHSPIQSNVYLFTADEQFYIMVWYPMGNSPVIGDEYFEKFPVSTTITPPASYAGTWKEVGGDSVLTVTNQEILLDDTPLELRGGAFAGVAVVLDGKEYDLCVMGDYTLYLRSYTMQDGVLSGWEDSTFFVQANHPTDIALEEDMYGTWKSQGQADLVIGADSITWGSLQGELIGRTALGGEVEGGVSPSSQEGGVQAVAADEGTGHWLYTVTFGTKAYHMSYSAETGSIGLETSNALYTFMGDSIATQYQGTWNVGGDNASTIAVTDKTFTLDGTACTLTLYGMGYTFQKDGVEYTVSLTEGFEDILLALSYTNDDDTLTTVYYLKEGTLPPADVMPDGGFVGTWSGEGGTLEVAPTSVTLNGVEGMFLSDMQDFYVVYVEGALYTMQFLADGESRIVLRPFGSADLEAMQTFTQTA